MSAAKLIVGLIVLAVLCITFTHSIKCFICTDKQSCKSPTLVQCNVRLANDTRMYLNLYYENVPETTSRNFDCIRERHKTNSGELYYHSGCIESHISGCFLEKKEEFTQQCYQCSFFSGCNLANRAELHIGIPLVPILLGIIRKCFT